LISVVPLGRKFLEKTWNVLYSSSVLLGEIKNILKNISNFFYVNILRGWFITLGILNGNKLLLGDSEILNIPSLGFSK
jgi:hypothetical protein